MKRLISIFIGIILISTGIKAQDALIRVNEIDVINSATNNVTVQIKTTKLGQAISSRINQTNVNQKTGFATQFNGDNTLLTLNFTQQFNENELYTLLEYSGIKLEDEAFKQLYSLLNQ